MSISSTVLKMEGSDFLKVQESFISSMLIEITKSLSYQGLFTVVITTHILS